MKSTVRIRRKPAAVRTRDMWRSRARDTEITLLVDDLRSLFKSLKLDGCVRIEKKGLTPKNATRAFQHPMPSAAAVGELLTVWHQDARFLDKHGNPLPLKITGKKSSFSELAKKAVPKIPVTILFDELVKLNVLHVDDTGLVRAKTRSLPVYNNDEQAAIHTVRSLRGFIKTLDHNLSKRQSSLSQLFHRIASNDALSAKQIPRLKIWLQRHGQDFLESADNWMKNNSLAATRPSKQKKGGVQSSIGIYLTIDDV